MRKKSLRRSTCAVLACLALGTTALAIDGDDFIVTLSYIKEQFAPAVTEQGEEYTKELLDASYDSAKNELDRITGELKRMLPTVSEGNVSESLVLTAFGQSDKVTMESGSVVLIDYGTMRLTHSGTVVDVTDGVEIASGAILTKGHRYIVAEDTQAHVEVISGSGSMAYQGAYSYTAGTGRSHPFLDITTDDPVNDAVSFVYNNGLFSGMGEGVFGKDGEMNRAMVMTVFYSLAGSPADEMAAADVSFVDVDENSWYNDFVEWGVSQNVSSGTGDDTFSPARALTQQEMIQMLYSFASHYMGLALTGEEDIGGVDGAEQVAPWANTAMRWAVGNDIVTAPLKPAQVANRGEVAMMLMNFAKAYS